MANGRLWTAAENAALLAVRLTPHDERHAGGDPVESLAAVATRLSRTESACRSRLYKLKLTAGKRGLWTKRGLWKPAEDDAIRARMWARSWGEAPGWQEVAEDLGRTEGACKTRACQLRKESRGRGSAA